MHATLPTLSTSGLCMPRLPFWAWACINAAALGLAQLFCIKVSLATLGLALVCVVVPGLAAGARDGRARIYATLVLSGWTYLFGALSLSVEYGTLSQDCGLGVAFMSLLVLVCATLYPLFIGGVFLSGLLARSITSALRRAI